MTFHLLQPVIVSPRDGAPYAASYAGPGGPGYAYVRHPQRGRHLVAAGTVTPAVLGDAVAARHAGGAR